jgi:hypothetical protein
MTALIDRAFFLANYPVALGKLTPTRKDGFTALFDAWDKLPHLDYLDWLAYAMATAWHETGATMQPVREGFAKSDADAYAKVTAYCAKKGIENYAARHANGQSYYGRGYVQLTHAYNYQKMGGRLGVGQAFYDNPDLVMQAEVAAKVLLIGLMEGRFRPKAGTLIDYFSSLEHDWFNARDLINGDKKAVQPWTLKQWPGGKPNGELVGGYGQAFRKALRVL